MPANSGLQDLGNLRRVFDGLEIKVGASAPAPRRRLKSPLQAEACSTGADPYAERRYFGGHV
jgi:hypothetical protein